MLSTLESLLRAMTAYFNYKAEQSKYELFRILEDTEDKIKKIKNEIKDAHDRGDLNDVSELLYSLAETKKFRDDLSNRIFGSRKRDEDPS